MDTSTLFRCCKKHTWGILITLVTTISPRQREGGSKYVQNGYVGLSKKPSYLGQNGVAPVPPEGSPAETGTPDSISRNVKR